MCLNDDHTGHQAVPLEHAFKDRRGMYENVTSERKKTENSKSQSVKKLKDSVQKSRKISVNDPGQIADILSALVLSLQKKQDELVRIIKQKQKESEKQTQGQITLLEQDLSDLRKRRSELEQLIKSEDYLYLLQNCPPNLTPANNILLDPFTEHRTYAGLVKQSVGQIKKSINSEIDMLIQKISSSDCCGAENMTPSTPDVWRPPKDKLMMIQQCNAVDVTLNSYSAHPHLTVTAGKTLSYTRREPFVLLSVWRFTRYYAVLGNEGFSSRRFYYEVDVDLRRSWTLGVVKESFNRDELFPLTPEHGVWVFSGSLCPKNIRRIGVFVDYERGEVSFYNTETRELMHSITGCCFTETKTGLQAFLYSVVGYSTVQTKALPFLFTKWTVV